VVLCAVMVVLKLRAGGAISPCRWCSGGGIHIWRQIAAATDTVHYVVIILK